MRKQPHTHALTHTLSEHTAPKPKTPQRWEKSTPLYSRPNYQEVPLLKPRALPESTSSSHVASLKPTKPPQWFISDFPYTLHALGCFSLALSVSLTFPFHMSLSSLTLPLSDDVVGSFFLYTLPSSCSLTRSLAPSSASLSSTWLCCCEQTLIVFVV